MVGSGVADGLGDGSLAGDGVDGDHAFQAAAGGEFFEQPRDRGRFAGLVVDPSCPRTKWLLAAKAETRWSAARPWPGRGCGARVLPSMAILSRGSGQQARTPSMKQAANRFGSIRLITILSQRPEGTPQSKGRNRRKNSRSPLPQPDMASKLSHSAIVAQMHSSRISFSFVSHAFRTPFVLDPGKGVQQKPQPRRLCRFAPRGVHQQAPNPKPHGFSLSAIRKSR